MRKYVQKEHYQPVFPNNRRGSTTRLPYAPNSAVFDNPKMKIRHHHRQQPAIAGRCCMIRFGDLSLRKYLNSIVRNINRPLFSL